MITRIVMAALLLVSSSAVLSGRTWAQAPSPAAIPPAESCSPALDLHFICGPLGPEDLVAVPGTRWIIASGLGAHGRGGLSLIDTRAKTLRKVDASAWAASHADTVSYPGCPTPPDPAQFAAHGLSLRAQGHDKAILYVVAHGGREAIEVFDVDAHNATPTISWRGCVPMPAGNAANSVTSMADGTIFATVAARPGTGFKEVLAGVHTGEVYRWTMRGLAFERIDGASLAGNNGIEVSPDGRELYVNASGSKDLVVFSLTGPTRVLRTVHLGAFTPDNVHWGAGGKLIVAGMREDEAACGPVKLIDGKLDLKCHRGSLVASIDPQSLAVHMLYEGPANPDFTGVATGLIVGNTLWLSSFVSDRVAYLPRPR